MGLLGKPFFFSPEFCKSYLKFENPYLGKIEIFSVFLFMFPRCSVHLGILSTDITKPAWPFWLFMWKRQLGQWLVKCVKNILRRRKKHQTLFFNRKNIYFYSQAKKVFDIFYNIKIFFLIESFLCLVPLKNLVLLSPVLLQACPLLLQSGWRGPPAPTGVVYNI